MTGAVVQRVAGAVAAERPGPPGNCAFTALMTAIALGVMPPTLARPAREVLRETPVLARVAAGGAVLALAVVVGSACAVNPMTP